MITELRQFIAAQQTLHFFRRTAHQYVNNRQVGNKFSATLGILYRQRVNKLQINLFLSKVLLGIQLSTARCIDVTISAELLTQSYQSIAGRGRAVIVQLAGLLELFF